MVMCRESDVVGRFGKEYIRVLGIGFDWCEYLGIGLRVGMGEMGDWGDEG